MPKKYFWVIFFLQSIISFFLSFFWSEMWLQLWDSLTYSVHTCLPPPHPHPTPITPKHPAVSLLIRLKVSLKRRGTHWLGVPGGERVGRLWVSSLSSDSEFLLTASQSVPPINFLSRGLLGDLRDEMHSVNLCHTPV